MLRTVGRALPENGLWVIMQAMPVDGAGDKHDRQRGMETGMITCPWCGTSYQAFQPSCSKCGGSLPLPAGVDAKPEAGGLVPPPQPPRNVPGQIKWRLLSSDGWAIPGLVFLLLGAVFGVLGLVMTLAVVTAFVGVPFALLGALFLLVGVPLLLWRYQTAQRTVDVLRVGQASQGEIVSVHQDYRVRVNGRYPWKIAYRFQVDRRQYGGEVTTLSQPDLSQQPGKPVYVLYMASEPEQNTLYPSPYGYYGL
jgi:hypothetical protein